MRIPDSLAALAGEGVIEEVLRPLMSGKEAQIYLLRAGGEQRVAKVYKAAQDRSFRQRAEYTEGRTVRNSRDQRAMEKRTRHGRDQDEAAWRAAEVDVIYRLHSAGVRVPIPYQFIDGVLIMELITDGEGNPAPRLGDVSLDRESALEIYEQLLRAVVKMLCAGVVHGDLSDFNVLLGPTGPVIIDFPQAVNAASNQNARKLLLRDVENLHRFVVRFVPEHKPLPYAEEMWQLYQRGELTPDARLSGRYRAAETKVDTEGVLGLIADAERDERRRRSGLGLDMRGTAERPLVHRRPAPEPRRPAPGPPQAPPPRPQQSVAPAQRRPPFEPRQAPATATPVQPQRPSAAGRMPPAKEPRPQPQVQHQVSRQQPPPRQPQPPPRQLQGPPPARHQPPSRQPQPPRQLQAPPPRQAPVPPRQQPQQSQPSRQPPPPRQLQQPPRVLQPSAAGPANLPDSNDATSSNAMKRRRRRRRRKPNTAEPT
ncbi:MAG: Family ership [Pseudomonadota bacterium]|jgi:RIO kinase 1